MSQNEPRRRAAEILAEHIREIPVAMLTTCLPDHTLRSRPMVNVNARFDGDLWFFTRQSDPKTREIADNPQVNLSFSEPSRNRYVSVSGRGAVVRDDKRAELLWNDHCDDWFPGGLDDPELALLKIEIAQAEYWDVEAGVMASITGWFKGQDKPAVEHEKVEWDR